MVVPPRGGRSVGETAYRVEGVDASSQRNEFEGRHGTNKSRVYSPRQGIKAGAPSANACVGVGEGLSFNPSLDDNREVDGRLVTSEHPTRPTGGEGISGSSRSITLV